jgi:hypothetical protein
VSKNDKKFPLDRDSLPDLALVKFSTDEAEERPPIKHSNPIEMVVSGNWKNSQISGKGKIEVPKEQERLTQSN